MAAVVELIPGSRLTTAVCTALEVSRLLCTGIDAP